MNLLIMSVALDVCNHTSNVCFLNDVVFLKLMTQSYF